MAHFQNLKKNKKLKYKFFKFGPDRLSRFDVYWIQTNKNTDRQTDKLNFYIE